MEKTDEKLASLIEKLQEAGFAQAPEVIDGAIRAIYWDGLVQVTACVVIVIIFCLAVLTVIYGIRKDEDWASIVGGIGSLTMFFLAMIIAFTNNPWIKFFDPQAALYQRIIEGVF